MINPGERLIIRNIKPQDIEQLEPLLETWIRDSETGLVINHEVDESMNAMDAAAWGEVGHIYEIAEGAGGLILGVMGLTDASEKLLAATPSVARGSAGELINAFVDPNTLGRGIGKALARDLESRARSLAYDDLLVTSGPRYRATGWPFWRSLYGDPILIIPDSYGKGADGPVWRNSLVK